MFPEAADAVQQTVQTAPQVTSWPQLIIAGIISSSIGGIIGALVAWGGIRIRLEHAETKITHIEEHMVFKDVCDKCSENQKDRQGSLEMDIKEIKKDVKDILKHHVISSNLE